MLQNGFFIQPTLILHNLSDENVQIIIQILREHNRILQSLGIWNDAVPFRQLPFEAPFGEGMDLESLRPDFS